MMMTEDAKFASKTKLDEKGKAKVKVKGTASDLTGTATDTVKVKLKDSAAGAASARFARPVELACSRITALGLLML